MSKTLSSIIDHLPARVSGKTDILIDDIVFDSRQVKPGSLFVAIRGAHEDGNRFIPAAIAAGARAIVSDQEPLSAAVPWIRVPDALAALSPLSIRFWDDPSRRLKMVGITGTNGKTTITYLLESVFQAAGWKTGVMGTINYRFGKDLIPAPNTTPFASEVQRFLARIAEAGAQACVMEVSSHALSMGRVEGVDFDVAVFTNLTQDHLDYHRTMEEYGSAKTRLFASLNPQSPKSTPKRAVINFDDPQASRMAEASRVPILRYRLNGPADIFAQRLSSDANGSRFEVHSPKGTFQVKLPLLGEYNVMNALATVGAACALDLPAPAIQTGLQNVPGVPGRVERILAGQPFTVVVDYAHTEDALRKVMATLKRLNPKRLITVFGCGGDRDRTKRPLMGEAAAELSDEVIVTSDNPRSEDPGRIALDVEVGLRRKPSARYQIILDREEAIAQAIRLARPGDILLIAGKGHEHYQIIGTRSIPFDDREVVRRILSGASQSS
ncbi:MAG: UDP-N-acetylmuramoyl-L-alanyl-D-glutamate--2,6-diaminopimelate ligase [Elusimicrobiota bacterium]|jgi:UDP-N-acetylmuramoyl-L-alanyl-D-glutamate--2,6-diaminopimelate ligase